MVAHDTSLVKIVVPTFRPTCAVNQELEIKGMKAEDVKSLHEIDPFMYYSIPGIRKAAMSSQPSDDVDHSNIDDLVCAQARGTNHSSSAQCQSSRTSISRCTCVSFEAHPSLLYEEILNNES